jgi:hypothetical protein
VNGNQGIDQVQSELLDTIQKRQASL